MELSDNKLEVGDVVYSKMGRDKGRYFVVMWVEDLFVGICDGELRKISNIKKKKYKHLVFYKKTVGKLRDKIISKLKVTNLDVKNLLLEFVPENLKNN